jgi:hypothetical protein
MRGSLESNDASSDGSSRTESNRNSIKSMAIRFVLSSAAATVAETGTIRNSFFLIYLLVVFNFFNSSHLST